MLLVFQFPIADIRSFFKEPKATKISLGSGEFIRGFGREGDLSNHFTKYERKLRQWWEDKNAFLYYTAKRGLSFAYKKKKEDEEELQIHKNLFRAKNIYNLRVAFRHFCFLKDSTGCNAIGRFEVGFFMKFPSNEIAIQQICDACALLAKLQTRQYKVNLPNKDTTKAARDNLHRSLLQSPKNIAKYFYASTTLREKSSEPVPRVLESGQTSPYKKYAKYVKAGTPLFFATLEGEERLLSPWNDDLAAEKTKNNTWFYAEIPVRGDDGCPVGLYVLEESGNAKFDRLRENHYSLPSVHIEYQGMKLITDLMKQHDAASMPYSSEIDNFQRLKDNIGKKITETLKKINKNCDAFDVRYILDANDAHAYEFLLQTLEYMDDRISTAKKEHKKDIKAARKGMKMKMVNKTKVEKGTVEIVGKKKIIYNTKDKDKERDLQNQLNTLSKILEKIIHDPKCTPEANEEIKKNLESFANESKSDKPDVDKLKTYGEKIENATKFAKNIAANVTACIKEILVVLSLL